MDSPSQLPDFLESCQRRIEAVLSAEIEQCDASHSLREAMAYACLGGGKRIRPVLVYGANRALDGNLVDADPAAAAVELIHSYSLVHDDLPAMDDDDLRRGKASVHKAFDEAVAILAGDALQSLAFAVLAKTSRSHAAATQLRQVQVLAAAVGANGMVGGQCLDCCATGSESSLQALEALHRLKTGALIRASVLLGAHSAEGATDQQLADFQLYADCIGLAFQIQDDILDVTADTASLGKPQGSDQHNDKTTYVSLLGLEQAQSKASEMTGQAISALDRFGSEADLLRELAIFITSRAR
jgi:geranylgeranyl pyrophosphate synthase